MARESGSPATERSGTHKPIGYLVKRIDQELDRYVDALLRARHGIGRGHWQVLRNVSDRPGLDREVFAEEARVFYDDRQFAELVDTLVEKGWIRLKETGDSTGMWLTEEGRRGFDATAATQDGTWATLTQGLSRQDYEDVLGHLERMLANLEAADPS